MNKWKITHLDRGTEWEWRVVNPEGGVWASCLQIRDDTDSQEIGRYFTDFDEGDFDSVTSPPWLMTGKRKIDGSLREGV